MNQKQMLFIATLNYHRVSGGEIKVGKDGYTPQYILNVKGGNCPYTAQFQSGQIIDGMNLELSNAYLFSAKHIRTDEEYGKQYSVERIGDALTPMDVLDMSIKMEIINIVDAPALENTVSDEAFETAEREKKLAN